MNRIYKVIWSKVKHQYVVVSELAHSCTKSAGSRVGRSAAAVLAALVLTTGLCAAPVQAEDLTDPYALLNTQVEETNSTSSDKLVTLVQSPLAKSVAPLANEDEGQPGEGGDTSGTTPTEPTEQHTIYNEEGFYAHNGNSTYNALTKDGLWVGGDDQNVGFHVDNEGNLFTNGTATFKQGADMGGQKITNVADGEAGNDAVNVSQLTEAISGVTYTGSDSVAISEGNAISVKTAENGNLEVAAGENGGLKLKDDITVTSVTAGTNTKLTDTGLTVGSTTSLTSGGLTTGTGLFNTSVTVGNAATGVKIADGEITNLDTSKITAGSTDAVNVKYLETYVGNEIADNAYTGSDSIAISDDKAISVKTAENGNLEVAVGENGGLKLKDDITVTSVTAGTNTKLTDTGLTVGSTTSLTSGGLTTGTGLFNTSVTVGNAATGVKIADGEITNLDTSKITAGSTDAVNVKYLETYVGNEIADNAYTGSDSIAISDDKAISVKTAENGNLEVAAGENGGLKLKDDITVTSVTAGTNTKLTDTGLTVGSDTSLTSTGLTTGTGTFTTSVTVGNADTGVKIADGEITNLDTSKITAGSTDAVNVKYLETYVGNEIADNAYTGSDSIAISGDKAISVKTAENGNLEVAAGENGGLKLKDDITVTSVTAGTNTKLTDTGLTVGSTTSLTGAGLTTGTGLFNTSVTVGNTATGVKIADGEITGLVTDKIDAGTDAVNVEYLKGYVTDEIGKVNAGTAYTGSDSIAISDDKAISVKTAENGNLEVAAGENGGLKLKDDITVTSVTAGTNTKLTDTGLTVGSDTSLTSTGLTTGTGTFTTSVTVGNADTGVKIADGEITNLDTSKITAGSTDAVNVKYLETYVGNEIADNAYTGSDSIAISGDKAISVKTAENGNLEVAAGENGGLKLKDDITVTSVTAGTNTKLTDTGLTVGSTTSLTSGGLTTGTGTFTTSVSVGTLGSTIQISNGKITGLDTKSISDEKDAVNVGFLNKYVNTQKDSAVQYDANTNKTSVTLEGINGTVINNVKAGDWSATSNAAAPVSQVYSKTGSVNWNGTNFLDNLNDDSRNLTTAVSALDTAIGDLDFRGSNAILAAGGGIYDNVTDALSDINTNIGNLTTTKDMAHFKNGTKMTVTAFIDDLSAAVGPMEFGGKNFIDNDSNLSSAIVQLDKNIGLALRAVGFQETDGKITTGITWGDNFHYIKSGTVVDGMSTLDNQIYNINTQLGLSVTGSIDWGTSAHLSGSSSIIDGMKNLDTAITSLEDRVDALEPQPGTQSTSTTNSAISEGTTAETAVESAPTETTATEAPTAATMESAIAKAPAAANSMLTSAQPMTMALNAPAPLANGDPSPVENPNPDGSNTSNIHTEGDMTTVEKDFTVTGDATFEQGASMGDHKITDVAAGTEDTDGVNYGQLKEVQNQVDANSQNIGILGSAVNKLGDRIERVGAGAAALAALHPLDFDPDNKLDFAAGFGNYRGASAVAVGAFYRPSENVMFSVGGAFGGGEDMVNAGVSFKVGAGSGSATTSRTAMAKSLKSMQEVVASQDAQLAQQREQIDKLTAMVELLMEQNGQAQPKDGDAQAAQPQQ